ncbi:MAG: UDP-N-acetylmuramate--L-alanine ligase [Gemmatimonadetes bacterium]|nr:UDP-N-acetylmuramate--L-alanine ligase [Gemmatimonadota bacterium]
MPLIDPSDPRPVHFMGIAGAGMSALAELCVRLGANVTGCDQSSEAVADLDRLGISVRHQHSASHPERHRALVVTSAVPKDHPELESARALGIPVVRRAEALAEVTGAGERLVAIAGTHGKSTTTVMTTEALKGAGIDATGVVGARVRSWNGNLSAGADRVFVVEADEYDRSFLALDPHVAVVTNIEADHLDIYRDLDDIRDTFARFTSGSRWLIACADDHWANLLPSPATAEVIRYGILSRDARLVARNVRPAAGGASFDVAFDGTLLGRIALGVPGAHNVQNALAAIAVGVGVWGASVETLARGLANYRGVERRFERLGDVAGVTVVDDYAHHPTEIRATLAAARDAFPGRRIIAAFQPHLFSRTRDFAAEFAAALGAADAIWLADIYPAREQPVEGVTSGLVADAMAKAGKSPEWTGARAEMAVALAAGVREGDVVITIGAGDVTKTGPELIALLGGVAA